MNPYRYSNIPDQNKESMSLTICKEQKFGLIYKKDADLIMNR